MALAEAQAWPEAWAMASSPRPWHGPGRKLVARKGSGSWHQTQGNVPKPQAMAKVGPYPRGMGNWVVGIGHRVLGISIIFNTLDARWVGG